MKAIIVTVTASLLVATVAQAQMRPAPLVPPQRSVDLQMAGFINNGLNDGYRRVVADKRGAIYDDEPVVIFLKVRLERGVAYRFAARCDESCGDLDMALVDARGRIVRIDNDPDDEPGFDYRPNTTGDYSFVLGWVRGNGDHRTQVGAAVIAGY